MTTNQTIDGVSRRMLTALLCHVSELENRALVDELRALLDAPAINHDQKASDHQFYTAQLQARAAKVLRLDPENTSWFEVVGEMEKAAAQAQGEPVAWRNIATGHVTTSAVVVMGWDDEKEQVQSLYAEQPAPVAVVMPQRKEYDRRLAPITWLEDKGWNACLDEVTRLNTKE